MQFCYLCLLSLLLLSKPDDLQQQIWTGKLKELLIGVIAEKQAGLETLPSPLTIRPASSSLFPSSGTLWRRLTCSKKTRCARCSAHFWALVFFRRDTSHDPLGKWKTVFLSSHITLFSAFHPSKVSVMPTRPSPSSAAASSISYLKSRTRNDYLCPEISRSDSGVNSFGKQMLIHHISLARIQKWLPWHRLNCEWQT